MWICHCHAVNDGTIREFAKKHGPAWKKLTKELGVATQCGICATEAKRILEEAAGVPAKKNSSAATKEAVSPVATPAKQLPCGKCQCTCSEKECGR